MLDILIVVFLLIIILLGCYNIKKTTEKFKDEKKEAIEILEIPLISVESQNRGALIKWDGDSSADAYIILLSETTKPENGTTLQLTADPKCTDCEHALVNLDPKKNYTVLIRGFKNQGTGVLSPPSNKVRFTPVQKIGFVKPVKSIDIDTNYKKCN